QDCGINRPQQPNTIVGYYPAYKYNLKSNDFNISSSITHLNYIAFGPDDLTNGTAPYTVFMSQYTKFNQFRDYLVRNPNRKFQLILSVLLPTSQDLVKISPFSNVGAINGQYNPNNTVVSDLVKIVTDISNSFDGIDIDYPNKLPCYSTQTLQQFDANDLNPTFVSFLADLSSQLKKSNSSKILTVTAGQYPINSLNSSNSVIISFVNIQAFYLNIGNKSASARINDIQKIFDAWNNYVSKSKLVLGIDFGGIVEVVTSSNITADTNNQSLQVVNQNQIPNIQLPSFDERIQDLCANSAYASWSWKNFSKTLLPCYTSTNKDPQWKYGFDDNAKQPYVYQQQQNSPTQYYYVSYEDFQSLKSKLDYVQGNALGIAIFDITKDTVDAKLMNFIIGNQNNPPQKPITPTSNTATSQPSLSNVGAIVGGIIGSLIFVSIIVAAGFILHRRRHEAKMSNSLINTNNQACSDTNPQIYSDINRQIRPDINRIYSDTNHNAF
ncbi:5139_t:CDS:2, partial [Cetraspora pellucida]